MKKICFIILLLITVKVFAQNQPLQLEKAYEQNSHKMLNNFFANWENEIKPITISELDKLSALQQEVYAIYKSFYNPLVVLPIVHGDQFNYDRPKYWVLQNQIKYQVIDVFIKDEHEIPVGKNKLKIDSIVNFNPNIETNKRCVYLSNQYEKIFKDFFTRKFYSTPKKDSKNNFLKNEITISHGMFKGGDGGYVITFPSVLNLQIDSSMQKAVVIFQYAYGAGYSSLEKIDGKWIVKETVRTLVE
ncbi:hypothetical protein GM921_11225 [Pedobacter sp. LMG 31464]|uniref:DUF3828 domain-containing protein n=1 Tax=Pedobacter planticolens TaxID=2679964 RepID=A0A923E0L3_9SPHI|nr:hypothetical protein [Pedobacter planticolens]MBB2146060.1 hypothetical protein [Pedobacter planticolens]